MQKLLVAAAAAVLVTGSALAADMPLKAPPAPAPTYSWTGCYVGVGGGYGLWNQDASTFRPATGFGAGARLTLGGRGVLGTAQVGCDYQFAESWVIGAFADYDFSSIKGEFTPSDFALVGEEKLKSKWAAGGRLGWLPFERLMTYVSAGYTQARFDQINLNSLTAGGPVLNFIDAHTYRGWFVGSGYEYSLRWLSGLTWKTEYRFAEYRGDALPIMSATTGLPTTVSIYSHKYTQEIRSELVWRFGGRY